MENQRQQVFSIVDPEFRDLRGHYFHYDRSIANEAAKRGWAPIIFASRKIDRSLTTGTSVLPAFSLSVWVGNPHPMWGNAILQLPLMLIFFFELLRAKRIAKIDDSSVLFFPTLLGIHILPIAVLSRPANTKTILMFRYQREFYESSIWARIGFWLLRKNAARGSLSLVSDSHVLAAELSSAISMPVAVIPIPHVVASPIKAEPKIPARAANPLLRFVYVGDARKEKGIIQLFEAIAMLPACEGIEFVLQVNDPDSARVRRAINKLRDANYPNVRLIETALPEDEYRELLKTADLILLPYISGFYRARTSGPFAEAVAAGKPCIVTEATWMAWFAERLDTGIVCPDRNPAALAETIVKACDEIDELRLKAENARSIWAEYHNPERCLDAILGLDFPKHPLFRA